MNLIPFKITERRIAFLFFAFGGIPAVMFAGEKGYVYFYQNFAPESLMWACGLGMRHPGEVIESLSKFTYGQLRVLDCGIFDSLSAPGAAGFFSKVQPYFTWSSAILWRLFGLNYFALLPLVGLLYGIYASGSYMLSRLFLGRKLAILSGILLCLAPLTVGMSIYLRDFSKAPFFIWAIVFLILSIREQRFIWCLIYAAAAAATIGVGYGFRADIVVLLPVGAVILAIGARPVKAGGTKTIRLTGILAPMVFLVSGIVVAAPVWTQLSITSGGGSVIIQGASEYFRITNGITPAGYTVGWTYSDELTLSGIAAKERPKIPDWDAREPKPLQGVTQAQSLSMKNLLSWADVFAADFFAQSLKSAGWILGFPALYERADIDTRFAKTNAKGRFLSAKVTLSIYKFLGQSWIPLIGALGAGVLLWRRFVHSGREALCLTLLFGFLITYPALQFSPRHVFHLEFVWIISILSLIALAFDPPADRQRLKLFLRYGFGLIFLIAVAYGGSVVWQRKVLSAEIARLLSLPRENVETRETILTNGDRLLNVAVPEAYTALVKSAPDSMTPQIRYMGIQWDVRAAADRLLVQLEGSSCIKENISMRMIYARGPQVWQALDAEQSFFPAKGATRVAAFFPAFYRPTQYFTGIVIPAEFASCKVKVQRIIGDSRLPMVMTANVSNQSIVGPLQKWPGWFGSKDDKTTITRKKSGAICLQSLVKLKNWLSSFTMLRPKSVTDC